MKQELDLTVRATDGPMVCIWKVMYGKGWLTSPQVMRLLEGCHFARSTLRNKLSAIPKHIVESRILEGTESYFKSAKEYRVVDGSEMPVGLDITKPRHKPDNTLDKEKKQKQERDAAVAANFANLLVARPTKSK